MTEVAWWQGDHGDEYTERNGGSDNRGRIALWNKIFEDFGTKPSSILEIGAGSGNNLKALRNVYWSSGICRLEGIEPNATARAALSGSRMYKGFDGTAANPGRSAELVFTSGVLIHIPPDELLAACHGIYNAAERYIVCIEYFSAEPEEKPYRGRKLWKRDFGSYWMDNFDLKPLGSGFAWKRTTGLDNLTWWIFEK